MRTKNEHKGKKPRGTQKKRLHLFHHINRYILKNTRTSACPWAHNVFRVKTTDIKCCNEQCGQSLLLGNFHLRVATQVRIRQGSFLNFKLRNFDIIFWLMGNQWSFAICYFKFLSTLTEGCFLIGSKAQNKSTRTLRSLMRLL